MGVPKLNSFAVDLIILPQSSHSETTYASTILFRIGYRTHTQGLRGRFVQKFDALSVIKTVSRMEVFFSGVIRKDSAGPNRTLLRISLVFLHGQPRVAAPDA
jgi:hypothetical protein